MWALNPPSRKALETDSASASSLESKYWALNPPSRKALETRPRPASSSSPLRMGTQPTQPKGIGDLSSFKVPFLELTEGHSTHPAERHWRPSDRFFAPLGNFPRALNPPSRKALETHSGNIECVGAERGALNPPSRKALETTAAVFPLILSTLGALNPPSRKALETPWSASLLPARAHRALNPPSRKALETLETVTAPDDIFKGGTQPTQPKGIGDPRNHLSSSL